MVKSYIQIHSLKGRRKLKKILISQAWWYMPIVPATQETEAGGSLELMRAQEPGPHSETLFQLLPKSPTKPKTYSYHI
jgi:hypothetical protein